jgi:hypothetical protein
MTEHAPRVHTRDLSSGRIHLRIRVGSTLFVDERCNLDQAGEYEEIDQEAVDAAARAAKCLRCYPPDVEGAAV